MSDSLHVKCPEQENPWRREEDEGLFGAGGAGGSSGWRG